MKKNIFIISIILILTLVIVCLLNVRSNDSIEEKKNNSIESTTSNSSKNKKVNKLNNNSNVISDLKYKNLRITDVSITIDKENRSTYTATITNTEDTNSIERLNIIFKDENNNEIVTLTGFIGLDLKKGEQTIISSFTDLDLSKATSVEYQEGN